MNFCHKYYFQELVKLTVMDLVMTVVTTIGTDFFRAVFVRYANNCWCWDLEKGFVSTEPFTITQTLQMNFPVLNLRNCMAILPQKVPMANAFVSGPLCQQYVQGSWAGFDSRHRHECTLSVSVKNLFVFVQFDKSLKRVLETKHTSLKMYVHDIITSKNACHLNSHDAIVDSCKLLALKAARVDLPSAIFGSHMSSDLRSFGTGTLKCRFKYLNK